LQRIREELAKWPATCFRFVVHGKCSKEFFNHATGSDGNCGCVTDASVACDDLNKQDLTDDVVSIYKFKTTASPPSSPPPAASGTSSATQSSDFDCDKDFRDWSTKWPAAKKAWCCLQDKRGCESTQQASTASASGTYDCHNTDKLWSLAQSDYCCKTENIGCTTTPKEFDCKTKELWTLEKQTWCCANENKGCDYDSAGAAGDDGFDCTMGDEDPLKGWSDEKKEYCCKTAQVGCSGDTVVSDAPEDGYLCDAGNEADWSSEKKTYCCLHVSRGCEEQARARKFQSLRGVAALEPRQLLPYFLLAGLCSAAALAISWRRRAMRPGFNDHPAYATVLMRAETECEE